MENRDPILLSRFQDESHRIRDRRMLRQYRLSVGLVALLIAATFGTMISFVPSARTDTPVVSSSTVRQS